MTLLKNNYYKILFLFIVFVGLFGTSNAQNFTDTISLPYKVTPENKQPYGKKEPTSNINFRDPDSFTTEVEYDPNTNQYIIRNKIGNSYFGAPYTMSFQEFQEYKRKQNITQHWRQRFKDESFEQQKSFLPKISVGSQAFETIFGSNTIDIVPQGSAKLTFGIKRSFNENPAQSVELQKSTTFDFKEDIRINVTGKVGENLEMQISYNTESAFDFENTMKIRYKGNEDDIIQKIEAGDITMPLSTSLIRGSQSLFGVLTELRFGNLYVTSVFSQQEGETKTINVEGGAQTTDYELEAVMYDKNRHFFLSHYFRDNYDDAVNNLPAISTAVKINKLEVWVTNTKRDMQDARNIVAFADLGEELSEREIYGKNYDCIFNTDYVTPTGYESPDNKANSLYEKLLTDIASIRNINAVSQYLNGENLKGGKDYEKIEQARKLSSSEYTYNTHLGYISLNQALNSDEVLAVAFEYTDNSSSEVRQVGEFSTDGVEGAEVLIVKLLKATSLNPKFPSWHLMMKNIYSMGAYQVNQDDFVLEVEYYDDETGAKLFTLPNNNGLLQLPDSIQDTKLLNILNLDNLNTKLEYLPGGDGVFDFVNGVTIDASKGKIIFPMVEPFGGYLKNELQKNSVNGNPQLVDKFVFTELYDSTQFKAEQVTAKNKYYLTGTFKSSGGSEIYLNSFNIPEGSVKVTAGGIELQEGSDYTVDYNMGRVKIVNQAYIASGTPLKITLENNSLFSIQSKTLLGTHLDYRFSDDFNLGATVLRLTERPLTEKVNIGEEPISNTIWGLNGSYRTDAPFLTKAVDFLPLIETKEASSISLEGEFAQLRPGHNSAVGGAGEAFIDDFEGSESSIDVKSRTGWVLASIPQQFQESQLINDLRSGEQRAKLAWYQIDPLFYNSGSPVSEDQRELFQAYRVLERDITDRDQVPGESTYLQTLDLAYYPNERGPYNYNTTDLNSEGKFDTPEDKWGGIMRELSTTDFETQNVEYIEFWMMDPFVEKASENKGGKLIFNLGNVSEDIVKDGRKSYEHGLPSDGSGNNEVDTTAYGVVPRIQVINTGFVNTPAMTQQDVGLDGLSTEKENLFFQKYLNDISSIVDDAQPFINDPSADNYEYFRTSNHDENEAGIVRRYKNYNNHEGNTPYNGGQEVATQDPDVEDINGDFTLSENEAYFQYEIDLFKGMAVGDGYISDVRETTDKGFSEGRVKWYQFRIPITEFNERVNDITDFKSIRFMRMFLTEWESPVVLRFAKLELVRAEWRKFDYAIKEANEGLIINENYDPTSIPFAISSVNIEENSARTPINYVLPPGVDRQQDPSNPQMAQLNEQSMSIRVKDLEDGYSKAVYKTINMDMRDYGNLQMYVHAEQFSENDVDELKDKDVSCFIRLGTDYSDNYYEYEVPLNVSPFYNSDREVVWPKANNVLINFNELIDLKQERNAQMRKANPTAAITIPFSDTIFQTFGGNNVIRKITIKGNPTLSKVKTLMIGIRNPLQKYNTMSSSDDGEKKSAEIWVNELRLTDFDEEGGWAATGRMSIRLADFATVSIAGSTTKAGFGSIEQTGQERTKDELNQVDVAANVELGRFFPKKANVRIPMYLGYSRTAINPKFSPLDQDVELKDALKDESLSSEEKDNLNEIAQDLTERKSITFTNVGIGKIGKGKTRFYSPSNLSASYAYSLVEHKNTNTKFNDTRTTSAAINYVFNNRPKNIVPFKKVKFLRKPYMRIIGDFNFYYAPSQISFQTNMNMRFNETNLRNLSNPAQKYDTTYNTNFNWERKFNLKYNFSKSLKLDYAINTNLTTDSPEWTDEPDYRDEYDKFKAEVWESIEQWGTPYKHNQKLNVSYTIPINKIPIFDWVSATARYSSLYNWDRGPKLRDASGDAKIINATISNSQKITLNNTFKMDKLYNKVGFIERIDKKYKRSAAQRKKKEFETAEYKKNGVRFTANKPKSIVHNLKTEEEIKVELTSAEGKPIKSEFEIVSENKVMVTVTADVRDVTVLVSGKREKIINPFVVAGEYTVKFLTGFKQISASYSLTRGSVLAGYTGNHDFGSIDTRPGLDFIFGRQDSVFPYDMAREKLLIADRDLIVPFRMTNSESINFKATYQPFKSLKIDFTAKRTMSNAYNASYFPDYDNYGEYIEGSMQPQNPFYSGSYSLDIWMIGTAFEPRPTENNQSSVAYDAFKDNIYDVAWQLADNRFQVAQNSDKVSYDPGTRRDTTMPNGYSASNPNVAIPAFLAAYSGKEAGGQNLNIFSKSNLRPTWRVKFDGLGKLDLAKKLFKTISLTHGYNSSFTVSTYKSNILYNQTEAKDANYGHMSWAMGSIDSTLFVPEYDISSFAVSEQFMPLFGIDMTWKSNVITKFEYKKTRAMTMSLANSRLTEVYSWDYVIGTGYRFDDLKLVLNQKPIVSDLNVRGDLSIRDGITVDRNLISGRNEVTAGQKVYTFKLTADYQLSSNLTMQFFFDHKLTNPKTTNAFRNSLTNFGFMIQFSLDNL